MTNPLHALKDESFIDLLEVNAAADETGFVAEIANRMRTLITQRDAARESATRVTDRNIELSGRIRDLERQPCAVHGCLECGNRGLHEPGCTSSPFDPAYTRPVENTSANPRDYYDTEYR
jgi:hypothetical protein